jgi:hypothetical protein
VTWCGVEEPLQANSQLLAVDESNGAVRCADFAEPRLCRYSFTQLGDSDLRSLVAALVGQFSDSPRWVLIWRHHESGDLSMRSRIRVSRLRAQGFATAVSEGVGVASLPFSGVAPDTFRPAEISLHPAGDGAVVLVAAEADSAQLLVSQAGDRTLAEAGNRFRFSPSAKFLSWLAEVRMRVLYESLDQLERPGLVLLSPEPLDVQAMVRVGVVQRVEEGLRAPVVWM